MIDATADFAPAMLLMGAVTLAATPLRAALERVNLPDVVGFILLGAALAVGMQAVGASHAPFAGALDFLARLGIVVLLFRVGLESNLDLLWRQIRRATIIWVPNMSLAGILVFALVYAWPGMGFTPALFAGVAAGATSIGVSVGLWQSAGRLDTEEGAVLLDVAALDDISAVVLLSVLFAVSTTIQSEPGGSLLGQAVLTGGWQLVKLAAFSAACYLFSRRLEASLSAFFDGLDPRLGPITFAAGTVFVIAACAELMGFSMAIGALFAGLALSRDREERTIDRTFGILLALFAPFFFVAIGFRIDGAAVGGALGLAVALTVAAVAGKLIGAGVPAGLMLSRRAGTLIGFSMVPRAEIFLVVMLHGLTLGEWAVPQELFTAAVLASLATCIIGPAAVALLLPRSHTQEAAQ